MALVYNVLYCIYNLNIVLFVLFKNLYYDMVNSIFKHLTKMYFMHEYMNMNVTIILVIIITVV